MATKKVKTWVWETQVSFLWKDDSLHLLCSKSKMQFMQKKKPHNSNCSKQQISDAYNYQKKQCQCVQKQYCTYCKKENTCKSCKECKKLLPKCTSYNIYWIFLIYFKITNWFLDCYAR